MAKYRAKLPQMAGGFFLTDGGIETTLIFKEGFHLPDFAAFQLLKDPKGYAGLEAYFRSYARLALRYGWGFILESPTWRANPDWGKRLGYSLQDLTQANHEAIRLLVNLRANYENNSSLMPISGCLGPRGDGYQPNLKMTTDEARQYHLLQIAAFAESEADFVTAITMNYVEEAIGITLAAQGLGLPVAVSFTVETDGKLPTGQSLRDAIGDVDRATNFGPSYYMINCAHPDHFQEVLAQGEPWVKRIHGLRSNASRKSHAELNESEILDEGNPEEFGLQHRRLWKGLNTLQIFGGCCGTDVRHVEAICKSFEKVPSRNQ